jgi:hypothetical protein
MDIEKILAVLESPTDESIRALLADRGTVFWIDWRQADETIAEDCESVLKTGHLWGELIETDSDEGFDVYLQHRERRVKVPLSYSPQDRHITLCALNRLLAPEYEIRLCIDSNGSSSLAFVALACDQWANLEALYDTNVGRRFYRFSEYHNLFTGQLPF